MSTVIQSIKILFFFCKILNYVSFHCGTTSASWSKTDYPPPWRYHICFKNCRVITQETTHIHTNHFCIRSEDLGMRFFFCKEFQSNVHQCRHYPSLEMSKFQLTFQYVSYLWFIREESFSWFRFRDPRITSAIDW